MIRINLLPHREQKLKARLARFAILAALWLGAGLLAIGSGYVWLSTQINTQDERNAFLTEENAKLDKQIAEIETLKKERQQLLDRKKVVERLQSNRGEAVKIFDQLARQAPEGIYLKEVKQTNDQVALIGYAQSSARVSTFMRSLKDSTVFDEPNLIEIAAVTVANQKVNQFNLTVKVVREGDDDQSKAPVKGPAGAKPKEAGK